MKIEATRADFASAAVCALAMVASVVLISGGSADAWRFAAGVLACYLLIFLIEIVVWRPWWRRRHRRRGAPLS